MAELLHEYFKLVESVEQRQFLLQIAKMQKMEYTETRKKVQFAN